MFGRKRRNYLAWFLAAILVVLGWRYYKLSQDFMFLCGTTGPHEASMAKDARNVAR